MGVAVVFMFGKCRWEGMRGRVAAAQVALRDPWGDRGIWSRPQNWTCPTDVYYDLGPGVGQDSTATFMRFTLTGHVTFRGCCPEDVQWYTPQGEIKTVDAVPAPFLEVERIIRNLTEELLPWSQSSSSHIRADLQPMMRAIARMAGIRPRYGIGYSSGQLLV